MAEVDDVAVDDEESAPGNDAAVVGVVVADDLEVGAVGAFGVGVRGFKSGDGVAGLELLVFEADGDIRAFARAPEEVEVVALFFASFEHVNCAPAVESAFVERGFGGGLAVEGGVVEEVFDFAELEAVGESEWEGLRAFEFGDRWVGGAGGEEEGKEECGEERGDGSHWGD